MLVSTEKRDLINCSFVNWYELFEKISIKSYSIPVPENVLEYLKDELLILPKECEIQNISEGFEDEDTEDAETPEFQEFSKTMMSIVKKLGGSAFLKTNWHCPKDSIWITACQSLRIHDLTDIYQLLKASSICKEDLSQLEQKDSNFLVFKKWKDIHPGTEFRCFVKNRNLIAISPRDWPQFHEHFKTQKQDIIKDIVSIFKEKIKDKFPIDNCEYPILPFVFPINTKTSWSIFKISLPDCFDVIRETKDYVMVIDFSPFNEKYTSSLAFDWPSLHSEELIQTGDEVDDPEFRYLASDCGIQPSARNNYGIPQDVIDMFKASSSTSAELNDLELERLNNLLINQMRDESEENSQ